jgi:uracil-DNA glycosylase
MTLLLILLCNGRSAWSRPTQRLGVTVSHQRRSLNQSDLPLFRTAVLVFGVGEGELNVLPQRSKTMGSYDPGPDHDWEQLFKNAPLPYYENYPSKPFHTRFGPVFYRGRLDGTARVLVVGQDPSTDEILAHRILIGQAGQLAQNFLSKIGLTRSYVMFNTFLFGIQSASLKSAVATDAAITTYRNQLLDFALQKNQIAAVLAFGSYAALSVSSWPASSGLNVIKLTHPTSPSGVGANWNSQFAAASGFIQPDADGHVDPSPYSTTQPIPATDIPRYDLPFGVPAWHGTGGGTHSQRGKSASFEKQIIWIAP